jgi:hypothetical protein
MSTAPGCPICKIIPYAPRPLFVAGGIRISSSAVTFRGFDLDEIGELAGIPGVSHSKGGWWASGP